MKTIENDTPARVSKSQIIRGLCDPDSYDVERDDAFKYREIPRGTTLKCMHCQTAFRAGVNELVVYRCTERPMTITVSHFRVERVDNPPGHQFVKDGTCEVPVIFPGEKPKRKFAVSAVCPHCGKPIATWLDKLSSMEDADGDARRFSL